MPHPIPHCVIAIACVVLCSCSASPTDPAAPGRPTGGSGALPVFPGQAGSGASAAGSGAISGAMAGLGGSPGSSLGGAPGLAAGTGGTSSRGGSGSLGEGGSGGGVAGSAGAEAMGDTGGAGGTRGVGTGSVSLPPLNAPFDYQLGGAYTLPAGVQIVSRDRTDPPAPGAYNICYVNGFQIQTSEDSFWLDQHPDLVLRDAGGDPVVDQDWGEMLIDVSTAAKRSAVAAIVGGWIAGCKADGFDAVEIDNLDSFSRSGGRLDEDAAVETLALYAQAAHAQGLAIAQKNSAELVPRRAEFEADFVVAEECNTYDECDAYTAEYGEHVLVIEYNRSDFDKGCADFPELSIVLRDVELTTPGSGGYVYDGC